MALLVISIIFLCAAIVLVFRPLFVAALPALIGLILLKLSGYCPITTTGLVFWIVATVIVVAIWYMLPKSVTQSATGTGFVGGGALVGACVGMIMSYPAMIIASVLCAFFGALAFSRTPKGAPLEFPSKKFMNWLCAKGLPAVVAMCMVAICLMCIITSSKASL